MITVNKFLINYLDKPFGILVSPISFSWQYGLAEGLKQKSYRIIVSSNKEDLNENKGNIWDSGEVISFDNTCIKYEGKSLEWQKRYYCKLLVKTNIGNAESFTWFETSINPDSFKDLNWVMTSLNSENTSAYSRANFKINKSFVSAKAYVAVLGLYEFYINGKKTDDVYMNPVITDPSKRLKFVCYDVTSFLNEGNNAMGVFIARGWTDFRRFKIILDVEYSDGEKERFTTDNVKFWEIDGPVLNCSIYSGEIYDANIAEKFKNWSTVNFTIDNRPCYADWGVYQRIEDNLNLIYEPQTLPGLRIKEKFNPINVKRIDDNTTVYSFDIHFSGWVRIKCKGDNRSRVTIRYAEFLGEDGRVDQSNLRMAKCRDIYILSGNGEEEYAPRFSYRGFCYVQIETEGNVKINSVIGEYLKTDVEPIGEFICSNKIINQLHKNIFYTEGSNQNSTLTDCNQRNERMGWLNDLCSRIYQVVKNYDMSVFFEKILEDISDTMHPSGEIADTAPNFYVGSIPSEPAAVCYLLAGRFLYEYYGNKIVLEKYYPYFKKQVEYLLSKCEDGILYFTRYGDWVPQYINNEKDSRRNIYAQTGAFSTEIVYWYLKEIIGIAKLLGLNQDQKYYQEKAEYVLKRFNEKFFDKEKGFYGFGTQTENTLPLYLGMVESKYEKKLYDLYIKDIVNLGYHSSCGNIAYRPQFDLLRERGDNELIERILVNPEYPGWGYNIKEGAISVWERWEKDIRYISMQSLSHPMFGSYDVWFYDGLAGINIKPYTKGFKEFVLSPSFNKDIDFVKCSENTINGKIVSNWERKNGKIYCEFIIPSNTIAIIKIKGKVEKIPENVVVDGDDIICQSGKYNLVIEEV